MVKNFHSKNDISSSGYEDNGSDTDEDSKHSSQTKSISEIVSAKTKYQGLQKQYKTIETQLESDDEVFLLKVPKWINPTDLINAKFSTSKKSKVKTHSETYHMKPLQDVTEAKLFINSVSLKEIKPTSILQLEKYVENKNKHYDIIEKSECVPLPKDLTPRHPIFGAKYEARIQLQEEIQQKLKQALQRFEETEKSSKLKKNILDQDEFDDKSLLISQILEEKLQSKKLKKMENTLKIENTSKIDSTQTSGVSAFDIVKQKKKKKKQMRDVIIEENIDGDIKNEIILPNDHPSIENNMQDCLHATLDRSSPSKTKKKQTDKDCIELIQSDNTGVEIEERKKKKKHKHSTTLDQCLVNEYGKIDAPTIKVELLSDPDLDESSFRKREKRKNRQKEIGSIVSMKEGCQENPEYAKSSVSPEKKRKKKEHLPVEVKEEIVLESENLEPDSIEKKKRKRHKEEEFISPETIKQEFDDIFIPPAKKRKPSILSSTLIKEASPNFKPDISIIEVDKRAAKKKNKQKSSDNQCDMIQDLLSNVRNSLDNLNVKSLKKKLSL